jgi:V-type H+-transporting ATPase subunit C
VNEENDMASVNLADKEAETRAQLEEKKGELSTWCHTSYGEAFSAWVHICAVRMFVESVLRYGLPPKFLGALIQPVARHESRVRKALSEAVGSHGAQYWKAEDGGVESAGDMFPYVSFTLDIDS